MNSPHTNSVAEHLQVDSKTKPETKKNIVKYSVTHKTFFNYSEETRENVNQVHLKLSENLFQEIDFYLLSVLPATKLTEYPDFYGNKVHYFEVNPPHKKLQIESRAIVSIKSKVNYDKLPYGCDHANLDGLSKVEEYYEFLNDSNYIKRSSSIWKEAIDVKNDSTDVFQTSYQLMNMVYEVCDYCTESTTSETTAEEFFKIKKGVCQDFAHLLIAYCRCLKIPARYVSGYIWDPSEGSTEKMMIGSQASHAWVEVYVPKTGWVGLDPTNNKVVNEQYIKIAIGRDYDDVAPIRGTFYGGGKRRTMQVIVDVKRIAE